jgi:hypothetical protein
MVTFVCTPCTKFTSILMSYGYFCQSYVLAIDITIGQHEKKNSTIFHYITYPDSCTLYRMVKTGHIEGVKVGYSLFCVCVISC